LYFSFVYAALNPVSMPAAIFRYSKALSDTFKYISIFTIPLYILSRTILLILAFIELRDIPPGALDTIKWANVLPFIH